MTASRRRIALVSIVFAYLAISCSFLSVPGLQYDEVLFATSALGVADSVRAYALKLGDHELPVMLMTYIGSLKTWLYIPLFSIFGTGPWVVRLPMIFLGVVTLVAVERIARAIFGPGVALLAMALLALDPSFVFGVREDFGPIAIMLATKTTSLALLLRFYADEKPWQLFVAFFLLGLGLFDKFNFIWHLGALGIGSVLVWPELRRFLTAQRAAVAASGFLTGCFPLLVYNVASGGGTLAGVEQDPNLWAAIRTKLEVVKLTLRGAVFPILELDRTPEWSTFLPSALVLTIGAAIVGRRHLARRAYVFCWVMMAAILGAILVTPKAFGPHHAMMLWPFPQLAVAGACVALFEEGGGRADAASFATRAISIGTAGVVLLSSALLDAQMLSGLRASGGRGAWSSAIYDLAEFARADKDHRLLLMDWGFRNQLVLLSHGRARVEEVFWGYREARHESELAESLHASAVDPKTLLVFMAPGRETFVEPRHVYERMLDTHELREEIVKRFYERDRREVFRVVKAVPGNGTRSPEESGRSVAESERGWMRAVPAGQGCQNGLAVLSLSWSAPGVERAAIHVNSPSGTLFTEGGESGVAVTGPWVSPGVAFYLQDVSDSRPLTLENTIVKLEPTVVCPR